MAGETGDWNPRSRWSMPPHGGERSPRTGIRCPWRGAGASSPKPVIVAEGIAERTPSRTQRRLWPVSRGTFWSSFAETLGIPSRGCGTGVRGCGGCFCALRRAALGCHTGVASRGSNDLTRGPCGGIINAGQTTQLAAHSACISCFRSRFQKFQAQSFPLGIVGLPPVFRHGCSVPHFGFSRSSPLFFRICLHSWWPMRRSGDRNG